MMFLPWHQCGELLLDGEPRAAKRENDTPVGGDATMAKTQRKITKAEREDRKATMEAITWAKVLVLQRLIAAGWDTRRIAGVYAGMEREVARHVLGQSRWDRHFCCEVDVAGRVTDDLIGGSA
jgi:hypothetical protein